MVLCWVDILVGLLKEVDRVSRAGCYGMGACLGGCSPKMMMEVRKASCTEFMQ